MESFNIKEPTDDFENKAFEVLRTSKASLLLNNNFPDLTKIFAFKTYKINSGRQFFKIKFFSNKIIIIFTILNIENKYMSFLKRFPLLQIKITIIVFLLQLPLFIFSSSFNSTLIEDNINKANEFLKSLKYDSAEIYFLKVMPELKNMQKWDLYCSTVNKYTTTLWRQGKLEEAEGIVHSNLENCYKYLDPNDSVCGDCFLNIGIISRFTANSGMSSEYIKKAITIYEKLYGHWHPKVAKAYEWLGTNYESVSDKANAYYHLTESLRIWKKTHSADHPDLGSIYRYLGLYYKRFSKHDSALLCFNKAKVLFDKKYGENNYKSVKCLNNICSIYEEADGFDTAMIIYDHALDLLNKSDAPNRYATMMTLFNIAEAYQNNGDVRKALQYFQKIFPLYFPSFQDENILANPETIEEYPFNIIKILFLYKARNLIFLSNEDTLNRLDYLKSAYKCYDFVDEIIDRKRMCINNYEVLLSHENLQANLMLEFAENTLHLYRFTSDTKYLSMALNYMEKNKKMSLMKQESHVDAFEKNIPEEIKQKRILLQSEYNIIKDLILNTRSSESIDSLESVLLDKKIELDMFNWRVSDTYPTFKYLNCPNISFSLSDIQKKIKSNQVLIQYSERCSDYISTPYEIIAMAITKDEASYFKIDGQKAHKLITDYYHLISSNDQKLRIDSIGYLLFELLLNPFANLAENKEIIIIPSQYTSLVPFDALPVLTKKDNKTHYMIEDHTIWKTYSVYSFLQENILSKPSDKNILAMAPGFTKTKKMQIAMLAKRDTSLIDLSGALIECKKINNFFKTKLVSGFDATEKEFKSLSGNYPVIHLSTHGVPDTFDETMVRLAFSKLNDPTEDGYLSMYEVFNLDLSADLVVLSACKTGIGELNKGVGNLSLAWAFNKAGAQSSVISLWDANDFASSVIMPDFYKYLADGNTKPEALRKAKIDFIKSSDDLTSNPYFWAGFEYYGNDDVISVQNKKVPVLLLIAVLFVVGILVYTIFSKKKLPFTC